MGKVTKLHPAKNASGRPIGGRKTEAPHLLYGKLLEANSILIVCEEALRQNVHHCHVWNTLQPAMETVREVLEALESMPDPEEALWTQLARTEDLLLVILAALQPMGDTDVAYDSIASALSIANERLLATAHRLDALPTDAPEVTHG